MFASFVQFIEQNLATKRSGNAVDDQQALRLAVAALCVEMARADMQEKPVEMQRAKKTLAKRFCLDEQEAEALMRAGSSASDQCVSLYGFTKLLNEHLNPSGKQSLFEMLWRVAIEDGKLDKYEDALMHKLAELLYVPLRDLMLAKQKALAAE
ncbi:MAG: TerB family tellurite resistance protein [Gammaproteobacteria bacterium]|nr:TerB family tellurite resistance protein [Gammaproteobacteria bacterium]MDE2345850.1 TerB family tellurite resistance protein [Gammaproteobacteria bacterium]